MAFFSPLSALSAAAGGAVKGYTEDLPKLYDMMGMEALGKAFQQGPVDQLNARGPQAPPPGQSSAPPPPMSPMAQGPMPDGQPPLGAPPPSPMAQGPMPGGAPPMGSPAAGGPPGPVPQQAPPGAPPIAPGGSPTGGMPQLDLQTLVQRIQQTSPNLPPQAMVSALTRAAPLLNAQGKQELALLRQQMMGENLNLRREGLDLRQQRIDLDKENLGLRSGKGGGAAAENGSVGGYTPEALTEAAERFRKTGTMPPGLRDRAGGNALRSAIANKAAELDKADNLSPSDIAKRQQTFKAEQIAIQRFMSGPQGNTTRSLGVVVDHLATMRDLATELQNGNIQAFNRVAQEFAAQTGSPAPTNFDTAKQIVGAEIIKALGVAGAGTQTERAEAANAFSRAKSPDQLMGAIKVAQRLLAGQVGGLRKQFVASTGLNGEKFDEMLGDEAKGFLTGKQAPAAASGGWSVEEVK